MISKVKGIVLVVVSVVLVSIMMPFTVYADTPQIIGKNFTLVESTYQNTESITVGGNTSDYHFYRYTYEIEYYLDDYYIGYVEGNFKYYYSYMPTTGSSTTLNNTKQLVVYCNSDSFKFTISFTSDLYDPLNYTSSYLTTTALNLTKISDLNSIEQIIDILTDLYSNSNDIEGLSSDQLHELQLIVSNTSLANTYLNNIDDNLENIDNLVDTISWIDISSNLGYRSNLSDTPTPWTGVIGVFNGYLTFSYDNLRTFDSIVKIYLPIAYYGSLSDIHLYFDNGTDVTDKYLLYITRSRIGVILYMISDNSVGYFGTGYINIKTNGYTYVYEPNGINGKASLSYLPSSDIEYWQLKSFFINDKYLNIIANGTNQSNSTASDLENEASEYSDIADDVIGVEEGLTSNFETEVNKIDLTSGLNVFGGNFMTSATWVRTQFDRLTENTPYGSLVVYGLTLGFALLMLGKVFL